jgi:hypothetical protein
MGTNLNTPILLWLDGFFILGLAALLMCSLVRVTSRWVLSSFVKYNNRSSSIEMLGRCLMDILSDEILHSNGRIASRP